MCKKKEKVAVTFPKDRLEEEKWENTRLVHQSRNAKIIDKYKLKFTAKVSRKGREKIYR